MHGHDLGKYEGIIKIFILEVDLDVDKGGDKNSQDNQPGRLCILLGRQDYDVFPDMPTMGRVILVTENLCAFPAM